MIAPCPRCGEPTSLPSASPDAEVRCPWCSESYPLRDAMAGLPPALIVIDETAATPVEAEFDLGALGATAVDTDDDSEPYRLAELDSSPFDSAAASFANEDTATIRTRSTKKKKTSGLMMLVQWIGGGVAGVAIAVLILWYLDRLPENEMVNRLKQRFQPTERNQASNQPSLSDLGISETETQESEFSLPEPNSEQTTSADEPSADEEPFEEGPDAPFRLGPALDPDALEASTPAGDETPQAPGTEEPRPAAADASEPGTEPSAVEKKIESLSQALGRLDELAGDDADETRRMHVAIFQQLTELGDVAAEIESNRDAIEEILERIAAASKLREALLAVTPKWIERDSRPNDGVIIAGVIEEGDEGLQLIDEGLTIVLQPDDAETGIEPGKRVLLLGKLIASETAQPRMRVVAAETLPEE